MNRLLAFLTLIFLMQSSIAETTTTVYESTDAAGNPSFSDILPSQTFNDKQIVIKDDGNISTDNEQSKSTQLLKQQTKMLDKDLQADDQEEQLLKSKVNDAQANLETAQKAFNETQQSVSSGNYNLGNDQVIDDDYIHRLEEDVEFSKQALSVAQENYYSFVREAP